MQSSDARGEAAEVGGGVPEGEGGLHDEIFVQGFGNVVQEEQQLERLQVGRSENSAGLVARQSRLSVAKVRGISDGIELVQEVMGKVEAASVKERTTKKRMAKGKQLRGPEEEEDRGWHVAGCEGLDSGGGESGQFEGMEMESSSIGWATMNWVRVGDLTMEGQGHSVHEEEQEWILFDWQRWGQPGGVGWDPMSRRLGSRGGSLRSRREVRMRYCFEVLGVLVVVSGFSFEHTMASG